MAPSEVSWGRENLKMHRRRERRRTEVGRGGPWGRELGARARGGAGRGGMQRCGAAGCARASFALARCAGCGGARCARHVGPRPGPRAGVLCLECRAAALAVEAGGVPSPSRALGRGGRWAGEGGKETPPGSRSRLSGGAVRVPRGAEHASPSPQKVPKRRMATPATPATPASRRPWRSSASGYATTPRAGRGAPGATPSPSSMGRSGSRLRSSSGTSASLPATPRSASASVPSPSCTPRPEPSQSSPTPSPSVTSPVLDGAAVERVLRLKGVLRAWLRAAGRVRDRRGLAEELVARAAGRAALSRSLRAWSAHVRWERRLHELSARVMAGALWGSLATAWSSWTSLVEQRRVCTRGELRAARRLALGRARRALRAWRTACEMQIAARSAAATFASRGTALRSDRALARALAAWRALTQGARAEEEACVRAWTRVLQVGRAQRKIRLAWLAWARRVGRAVGARRLRRERRADADLLSRLRADICAAQLDAELERRRTAAVLRRACDLEVKLAGATSEAPREPGGVRGDVTGNQTKEGRGSPGAATPPAGTGPKTPEDGVGPAHVGGAMQAYEATGCSQGRGGGGSPHLAPVTPARAAAGVPTLPGAESLRPPLGELSVAALGRARARAARGSVQAAYKQRFSCPAC